MAKPLNVDDLRLDALIKEGTDGDVVIVGCPFDYVRKRSINKGGEENGPCCLRRFYYKVGPLYNSEYELSIADLSVKDYGNVTVSAEEAKSPEKVILKIQSEILGLIKNNHIPFVIGGSKECTLGSVRAFHQLYPQGKHLIMAGMPFLRRPYDNDKLTSENLVTVLGNQFSQKQILFGPHQDYFPKVYEKTFQHVSFNQIYAFDDNQVQQQLGLTSKPVKKLRSIIRSQIPYHVTLSCEAIERFNGCRDLTLHGIRPQEMTEIFYWLGQQQNIKSIDITEFNPSCQDYESSLILLNLLYHYLMGKAKRSLSK